MSANFLASASSRIHLRRGRLTQVAALVGTLTVAACGGGSPGSGEASATVTVYTGRHYGIEKVFEQFTAETGIRVRFTTGSDPELRERLVAEGANTPADLLITADAANIALAAEAGALAPLDSTRLQDAIPADLRAADGTWYSLSRRLRVIMYSSERVADPPTTYAEVGDPRWKGRLCLRPSTHAYTQSLVASLINNNGEPQARAIVESWIANDPVFINSDTDILKAIAGGECDVALANTYYLARLLGTDAGFPVRISWPDQGGAGAHLNVSAGAVTAASPNRTAAVRVRVGGATDGQALFSEANNEYPANPAVAPGRVVAGFGTFVADVKSVRRLGPLNREAVSLLSSVGYE